MPLKKLFLALSILTVSIHLSGQYNPDAISGKAVKIYDEALQKAADGNVNEGIILLNEAVKIAPGYLDAYLSLGGMYGERKNYPESVRNYEKAKSIDSSYFNDYSLPYSINLAGLGDFRKALKAANSFLQIPGLNPSSIKAGEYRRSCYMFAIAYDSLHPQGSYKFQPSNLGDSINSAVSEYFPTITIDGHRMVYTRRVRSINEDFYGSSRVDGKWQKSRGLPGEINTNDNEGAQNISQDGQWLIFTGCNFPEGFGSCDLYISYDTEDGWSMPQNLGETINTEAWESMPSLSPDKRDLYFSSNRGGGFGGSDIYISHRMPDGNWSAPENAGAEINTKGDENSPFIHADNQTLYFTSNGHPGYGGEDLFMIRKQQKNKWGVAENLGFPVNTIENEGSLVIASDGKTAYYASDRSDSRGLLDIYTFELRPEIRPAKTLWVTGKVFDIKTKKGLPSAIELTDLSAQDVVSKVQTDGSGNYLVTLPVGKDYGFNVNRKGYLFFSENFSLSHEYQDSTYHIDIGLQPLETNASVILKNIFFDVNRFELKPESFGELDNLVKLLKENPTLKILISGHTDNTGNASDNLKLSNSRAQSVVKFLIEKGIDRTRLSSKGQGSNQPIADNTSEAGRSRNRRTEMKVIN